MKPMLETTARVCRSPSGIKSCRAAACAAICCIILACFLLLLADCPEARAEDLRLPPPAPVPHDELFADDSGPNRWQAVENDPPLRESTTEDSTDRWTTAADDTADTSTESEPAISSPIDPYQEPLDRSTDDSTGGTSDDRWLPVPRRDKPIPPPEPDNKEVPDEVSIPRHFFGASDSRSSEPPRYFEQPQPSAEIPPDDGWSAVTTDIAPEVYPYFKDDTAPQNNAPVFNGYQPGRLHEASCGDGQCRSPRCEACGTGSLGLRSLLQIRPFAGMKQKISALASDLGYSHDANWRARPFSVGIMATVNFGSMLEENWISMTQGAGGILFLNWDASPHWGFATRFSFASIGLSDAPRAKTARYNAAIAGGMDEYAAQKHMESSRAGHWYQWDILAFWYPFGDTRVRPFLGVGLGAAQINYTDAIDVRTNNTAGVIPLMLGLRTRVNDWLAFHLEVGNNFSFGAGRTGRVISNTYIAAGIEFRFGGQRTMYWPYDSGVRRWWF